MKGVIHQLNCSAGGVPKLPVAEAQLTRTGLIGDAQAHRRFHGGPERALCLFSLEKIGELRAEGHTIYPGSTGENVTVAGLEWAKLKPGDRLALGEEAVIEISSYTAPCKNIAASFARGEFTRISQKRYPGDARLYARVLREGKLATGAPIQVLNAAV
jgi:MOSC domain-containing protein YiiM